MAFSSAVSSAVLHTVFCLSLSYTYGMCCIQSFVLLSFGFYDYEDNIIFIFWGDCFGGFDGELSGGLKYKIS